MIEANKNAEYFISLLAAAVSDDSEDFALPGKDVRLEEIYRLAQSHGVTALVYEFLQKLGFEAPDSAEYRAFTEQYYKAVVKETEQDIAFSEVCGALREGGAEVMPIKGIVCKHYYPKTYYRSMTDVDILYRGISRDYVHDIMESLGYTMSGSTASYHDTFVKPPHVSVELHESPVSKKDLSAPYFDTVFTRAVANADQTLAMTREDEYIYMLAHAARHFFDGGLGVRPLLDIYLFRLKFSESLDKKYVKKILKSVKLENFEKGMLELVGCWFEGRDSEFVNRELEEFFLSCKPHGTGENSRLSRAARNRGPMSRLIGRLGFKSKRGDGYEKLERIYAKFR